MATIQFVRLNEPTAEIAETFTRWDNDPQLVYLSQPNKHQEDLERQRLVTPDDLAQRIMHDHLYLLYLDDQLVGEMSYQVDPQHLFRQIPGTAWIGITIGEAIGRGKGVGREALRYLEQQIQSHGLVRIELGVFEFNTPALALYRKLAYQEIGSIPDFTYWQDRMWHDIRMEKNVT